MSGPIRESVVDITSHPKKSSLTCQQYQAVINDNQLPIVYSSQYNITFWGLQKLHPFDSQKWGHIFKILKDAGLLSESTIVQPMEISENELLTVHTQHYLNSLKWSVNVARITEVPPLIFMPNFLVQRKVLRPFKFHTSGTIMGGRLAVERGWAINIGGGFHHCSHDRGGGFCAYADITLSIKYAFENLERMSKVLIIDLDAHQGNGYARDFMDDPRVYIVDIYNRDIYPNDKYAKRAIRQQVELNAFTKDKTYLRLVDKHINQALAEFTPDLVVYNAGTDILEHDPLGALSITQKGIIERDQIVFSKCRSHNIPILMITSGGYLPETAKIVADSIMNLNKLGLISCGSSTLSKDARSRRHCRNRSSSRFCFGRPSPSLENISDEGGLVTPAGVSGGGGPFTVLRTSDGGGPVHLIETSDGGCPVNLKETSDGARMTK